jgi:hypothetical protein
MTRRVPRRADLCLRDWNSNFGGVSKCTLLSSTAITPIIFWLMSFVVACRYGIQSSFMSTDDALATKRQVFFYELNKQFMNQSMEHAFLLST